jgi:hypothetical protein
MITVLGRPPGMLHGMCSGKVHAHIMILSALNSILFSGWESEGRQEVPFAGAAAPTEAEVAEFLLPPTPPRLLLSSRNAVPHHYLQQNLNTSPVATLSEVDACCAAAQEHSKMVPEPLRHISHVALEKILRYLPLHACAELPLPLRLSALWSKCKTQPSSCLSARVEPVRATPVPEPRFSLTIADDNLSSAACARLFHLLPLLPPLQSLTVSHPRFLGYNVPRPPHRRRLPAAERLWKDWTIRQRYVRRRKPLPDAELHAENERKAASQRVLDQRTCEATQAVLYRALESLAPSLTHLSLAGSTVNTRTLRVMCVKLRSLESLDLSYCVLVGCEDLRPLGSYPWALDDVYPCTQSLGFLKHLKRLSLKGVKGAVTYDIIARIARVQWTPKT